MTSQFLKKRKENESFIILKNESLTVNRGGFRNDFPVRIEIRIKTRTSTILSDLLQLSKILVRHKPQVTWFISASGQLVRFVFVCLYFYSRYVFLLYHLARLQNDGFTRSYPLKRKQINNISIHNSLYIAVINWVNESRVKLNDS